MAFYKVNNKKAIKAVVPEVVTLKGTEYRVAAISDNAFSGCKKMQSVSIGNFVTKTGNNAFYKCTSLEGLTDPANVVKIGRNSFMIDWLYQEEGVCEGNFKSKFFRDDENSDVLNVCVQSPDLMECAEKCVESFNNLTEYEINQICKESINCAKEGGINEEFELPALENALDILNYCWFTILYVNMLSQEDEISYVVEGEGDWGEVIGFVVNNNKVIYVCTDYFDYMKDGE